MLPALLFVLGGLSAFADGDFQGATHLVSFDDPPFNYSKAQPNDPVAELQRRLEKGEAKLKFDADHGYLDSLLQEFKIPKSSQVLVFSKTSFQRERISPSHPRALYFNDDVYIGFIPGSPLLEVSTADPTLGGVFYSFDQTGDTKPKFRRTDQCLECHASGRSMGVPGHVLRSFVTDSSGGVEQNTSISEVNDRTPFEDRWGGWYVTGNHGKQTHRGNLIGSKAFTQQEKTPNYLGNITDLSRFFDVTQYPGTNSDVVALMVLEHQVHLHNFLARLHYETTLQLERYGHINYVTNIADSFLRSMLFTEEFPIKDRIAGDSSFTRDFENLGPKDATGRSLRQFDLQTRLFKYPCSYLIYSKAFDALPDKMKAYLYQRLWNILTDKDSSADFRNISTETKQSIRDILIATKPGLPDYWKQKLPK